MNWLQRSAAARVFRRIGEGQGAGAAAAVVGAAPHPPSVILRLQADSGKADVIITSFWNVANVKLHGDVLPMGDGSGQVLQAAVQQHDVAGRWMKTSGWHSSETIEVKRSQHAIAATPRVLLPPSAEATSGAPSPLNLASSSSYSLSRTQPQVQALGDATALRPSLGVRLGPPNQHPNCAGS